MAFTVTVNGSPFTLFEDRFTISMPANGFATLNCRLRVDTAAEIPDRDDEIMLSEGATVIFGGTITNPRSSGIDGNPTNAMDVAVTANDFNSLTLRQYLSGESFTAGMTLKDALLLLVSYLPGVTLDAGQADGPTLETTVDVSYWLARNALDYLTTTTGWVWRVDATKTLKMIEPGSVSAPFDIADNDGNIDGDLTVEPKSQDYANRVRVVGAGVFGLAEDAGEISAHGPYEFLAQSPDTADQPSADALAAAVLAAKLPVLREVTYPTLQAGVEPGQTQTIQSTRRGIDNIFLITQVNLAYTHGVTLRQVTAIEGLVYKPGWREKTRTLFGGGGNSGASLPGIVGGASFIRYFVFLGGTGDHFVRDATPTWVFASPMVVQVNTVPRGTLSATITAQLRALDAGVSVRARLFDITDSAACSGLSSVVTSTTWQTVTWTVTLTAGSHLYGLQLLPGSANADVGAIAYLE